MFRSLRASVPMSKLIVADRKVREYMLYYVISLASALNQPIITPDSANVRTVTPEQWEHRGRELAALTPSRFTLPPDSVMDLLEAAARHAAVGT